MVSSTSALWSVRILDQVDVLRYNAAGVFQEAFDPIPPWEGSGRYGPRIHAIAFGPDGDVFVTETSGSRIVHFTADGAFVDQWGTYGYEPGQIDYPIGVACDAEGSVFVADRGADRVQKFTAAGELLGGWGETGSGSGELLALWGIALGLNGQIYVVDGGNDRVQEFELGRVKKRKRRKKRKHKR